MPDRESAASVTGRDVYQRSIDRGEGEAVADACVVPRPLPIRERGRLRVLADRVIAAFSLVPVAPVLDVRVFCWTRGLRDAWRTIREEALATASLRDQGDAPFVLWRRGARVDANIARCPATAAAVGRIPGLESASFAILPPGAHVPRRRGATRGLLTCHLGLIVPRDGDVRMRVGDRMVRWAEGETLVFDDTYDHEAWNDTGGTRVVLRVRVRRPLRQPGRWFADTLLRVRSARSR
ncbi:aspartyl/asparaginyl beta-hydroxylase domain-containing protein [Sphingomonas sp.]|uniref:aspartyl/asparaginyl beta-hydroxylase domain-containing protein n=1 Tax=Sphingomonas sp. TaxID=28214 RepID=UPI002E15B573|nr:aspartyl/asparaginyl beta-hydroxylase domain-containing protein [Sphingomonas sp.]